LLALTGYVAAARPANADMAAAQTAIASGNFVAAGAALQPLAQAGDAQAQYQWASLALDGHPVGLTSGQAISLLIQSAAQGNSHAQARLGMAYAKGDHVTVDDFAAYHWLSRASVAPDLTSEERSNVTALRQSLLERLAPSQTNYVTNTSPDADADAILDKANQQHAIAAADKAQAAPVDPVATAPLPDSTPPAPTAPDKATGTAKPVTTADTKPSPVKEPVKEIATVAAITSDPTPTTRKYMVQLESLPSATIAVTEAQRLQKKYATILQDSPVSVRQVDLGSKGIRQRVVAGPFDSFDTAKARCTQLSAQKQDCRVISVSD
jgi:hypothetical protein